eukprot:12025126-Ditylum_brightwellii.AAC.1
MGKKEEEEEDGMHISDDDESENEKDGMAATEGSEVVELKEEGGEEGEEVEHPVKKLSSKDNHCPPKKDRKDLDHHH